MLGNSPRRAKTPAKAAGIPPFLTTFAHGGRHNGVIVFRQNDPCIDMKRGRKSNRANGRAKRFDFAHQKLRPAGC
jgi:hypothetical protein